MPRSDSGWTVNALAEAFDCDRRTVARRLRRAGVEPLATGSKAKTFPLREAAEALLGPARAAPSTRPRGASADAIEIELRRATAQVAIGSLAMPIQEAIPMPATLIDLRDLRSEFGIADPDDPELGRALMFGLPVVPELDGNGKPKRLLVSRRHFEFWRESMSALVMFLGGEVRNGRIGEEFLRLRDEGLKTIEAHGM